MARARNIKPGIMENEDLAELNPLARLLFIYLWMLADCEGRLEDRPRRIKAQALPYDDVDIDSLLSDLASKRFIVRYQVNGERYIQVIKFVKHQYVTKKEKDGGSSIPPYIPNNIGLDIVLDDFGSSSEPVSNQIETGIDPVRSDKLNTEILNTEIPPLTPPKGGEVASDENSPPTQHPEKPPKYTPVSPSRRELREQAKDVLAYFNKQTGSKYRSDVYIKAISARLREGFTVEQCREVIDRKRGDPFFTANPQHLNPETLFRPSKFEKYLNEKASPDDDWSFLEALK